MLSMIFAITLCILLIPPITRMDGSASNKVTTINIISEERRQDLGLVLHFGISFSIVDIKRAKRETDCL